MKKAEILCVGRIKEGYLKDGIAEYLKRLNPYIKVTVTEIDDRGDNDVLKESDKILEKMSGYSILLDIGGESLSSIEFANKIDKIYISSPNITFIIGGSRGVDDRVKAAADFKLSFGKITYPHQLMRLILTEQLYRAASIINNTPYHK